jgi:hypothetical protein
MRIFYDCEFIEDGRTIDLISIGLIAEAGDEYYAVKAETPRTRARRTINRALLVAQAENRETCLDA